MEPEIRYCTTSDGVNIAYSVTGSGPVLLWASDLPTCHVSLEWQAPAYGPYLEPLAAEFTLIRFDARGLGLSDRDVSDFSFEARMRDLEAVIAHGVRGRFALMAQEFTGPMAITYAAAHPGAISHLILLDTFARTRDFVEQPRNKLSMELLDRDWEMFVDNRLTLAAGDTTEGVEMKAFRDYYLACVTEETDRLLRRELGNDDATESLASVETPTLILHHTGTRTRPTEFARRLAAGIHGSKLILLNGGIAGQWSRVVSATVNFVKGDAPVSQASGAAVILFTDIADSTALTERLGDTRFRDASRALDAGLRSAIREAGGAAIDGKLLGDGVLATFPSAARAIDGARRCLALSAASELGLHIGLHAGDVIREENNVFGGAVNIAARICALSEPGQILVSDVVRGMARSSAGVEFEDRGEQAMKGVGEPVRVYEVRGAE
jgi:class 3 adenylate cyclase/pimeloyl-ACP methyl ester carboxylesterase